MDTVILTITNNTCPKYLENVGYWASLGEDKRKELTAFSSALLHFISSFLTVDPHPLWMFCVDYSFYFCLSKIFQACDTSGPNFRSKVSLLWYLVACTGLIQTHNMKKYKLIPKLLALIQEEYKLMLPMKIIVIG